MKKSDILTLQETPEHTHQVSVTLDCPMKDFEGHFDFCELCRLEDPDPELGQILLLYVTCILLMECTSHINTQLQLQTEGNSKCQVV